MHACQVQTANILFACPCQSFPAGQCCVLRCDLHEMHVYAAATTRNQAASARARACQTPWRPRVLHRAPGPRARSRALRRALAAPRMPRRPLAAPQPQEPWAPTPAAAASRRSTRSRCTARSALGWLPPPRPGAAPGRTRASAGAGAWTCSCRRPARRRGRRAARAPARAVPPRSAAWTPPRSSARCCASLASDGVSRPGHSGDVVTMAQPCPIAECRRGDAATGVGYVRGCNVLVPCGYLAVMELHRACIQVLTGRSGISATSGAVDCWRGESSSGCGSRLFCKEEK